MIKEKSFGAVVFRENGERKYLVMHYKYKSEYFDFPRGNIEENELEKDVVIREIKEETGIEDIMFIPNFREKKRFFYRRERETVSKEIVYYLVQTKTKEVKISKEHIGFKWLSFNEAHYLPNFKSKEILEKAYEFLKSRQPKLRDFK